MNFSLQNYWRYFSDIKPEMVDKNKYKKELKYLFIEDFYSNINSDTKYQLDLQFFRIIQAINLGNNSYHFIGSKDFKYSNDYSFKKIFVLGKDSLDSLEKNQEFIRYIKTYGRDYIEVLPSSFEMYTNPKLKKEAWEKLKKVVNY